MITCPNCGTQNSDGSAFCANCGSSLAAVPPAGGPAQQQTPQYQQYPQQQGASGKAIAALVLALLGLVMCGPFTAIPAMIIGKQEMNAIDAGEAPIAGKTLAQVGFWVGLAVTILSCLVIMLYVVLLVFGLSYGGMWM